MICSPLLLPTSAGTLHMALMMALKQSFSGSFIHCSEEICTLKDCRLLVFSHTVHLHITLLRTLGGGLAHRKGKSGYARMLPEAA